MKIRVILLVTLLVFRCILGWISVSGYDPDKVLRVTGKPVILYQSNSEYILKIGKFIFSVKNIGAEYRETRIKVIGNPEMKLIDSLKGNLWLRDATIDRVDRMGNGKNLLTIINERADYFRNFLVSVVNKFVPAPEAGLVSGVLLGYKYDIGQDLYDRMIRSGTVHIAVASGYNILLVGGTVLSLCFWFVRRDKAIWIALMAMIFYAILAGGDPPVIRAVWMAGFLYLSTVLGRGTIPGWILGLTAWVMLMIDPTLLFSASFQLSVAASFGLMVVEPWMTRRLSIVSGTDLVTFLGNSGLTTSVATIITTMPILWWHFGRMNLTGIFSNSLILPLVPPLMILGTGMLIVPGLFAWPVYAIAHWIILIINFFGTQ